MCFLICSLEELQLELKHCITNCVLNLHRNFISKLSDISRSLGMSIARDPVEVQYFPRGDVEKLFNKLCTQYRGLQLIVAVLDKKGYGISYSKYLRCKLLRVKL